MHTVSLIPSPYSQLSMLNTEEPGDKAAYRGYSCFRPNKIKFLHIMQSSISRAFILLGILDAQNSAKNRSLATV